MQLYKCHTRFSDGHFSVIILGWALIVVSPVEFHALHSDLFFKNFTWKRKLQASKITQKKIKKNQTIKTLMLKY
jgi:hypothetical protein